MKQEQVVADELNFSLTGLNNDHRRSAEGQEKSDDQKKNLRREGAGLGGSWRLR